MLDLLPLRQCFGARSIKPDPSLPAAIGRMAPMLRTLLMGDGLPARFNGVGFTERDALATALAYDESPTVMANSAPPSGYLRLERGSTAIVMDAGAPPDLDMAGSACAGSLSFEMSTGSDLLLVNAGTADHARCARPRFGALHGQPQHALSQRPVVVDADPQRQAGAGDRRRADPSSRRGQMRGGPG